METATRALVFSLATAAATFLANPAAGQSAIGGPVGAKNQIGGAKASPNLVVPPVRGTQGSLTAKAKVAPPPQAKSTH